MPVRWKRRATAVGRLRSDEAQPALPPRSLDKPLVVLGEISRRIILVRDPLQRLLSAYSNRVVHHHERSPGKAQKQLTEHDLAPNPSLQEFIAKLPQYARAVETINHHMRSLVDYAGGGAGYYSRIYRMLAIGDMVSDISAVVGRLLTLARLQTGGPKIGIDALGSQDINTLLDFDAEDYRVFGGYFSVPGRQAVSA
nr:sulfotransferase family 2 domain-containing protein [Paracoccus sp. PAR01]